MKWIIREIVRQEYVYEVEAETLDKATQAVKQGLAGTSTSTRELSPEYIGHPRGYPFSVPQ